MVIKEQEELKKKKTLVNFIGLLLFVGGISTFFMFLGMFIYGGKPPFIEYYKGAIASCFTMIGGLIGLILELILE